MVMVGLAMEWKGVYMIPLTRRDVLHFSDSFEWPAR